MNNISKTFFFSYEIPLLWTIFLNTKICLFFLALDTKDTQVKKGIFELLSALCVYSAEGYSRALEALEHYKKFKSERYRFLIVLSELQTAKTAEYKTVLLAFINCLIISTPQLKVNNENRRTQYYSIR